MRFDTMVKNSKKKDTSFTEPTDDYVYDEVTGARGKKTALSLLNKRVVGDYEMDELFCDWG